MSDSKFFIEIGSCDFGTLNHLAHHGWQGMIVEPVEKYLNRLERLQGVHYVNKAIDITNATKEMFVYKDSVCDNDRDFSGMSSFGEYVIDQNRALVEPVLVSTITYAELMYAHDVKRVDFLKIDTEGHDWVILQLVIYAGPLRPKLIKAETKHLGENLSKAVKFLEERKYLVYQEKEDLYAIDLLP
jgi:FkbM family methyltransferase